MKYVGNVLHVKQGETFSFSGTVLRKEDRTPVPSDGLTVRSQIRRSDRSLVADLVCAWLDDGAVSIRSGSPTTEWTPGPALWDVQVIDAAGQVRVTDSVEVVIDRYVTRGE